MFTDLLLEEFIFESLSSARKLFLTTNKLTQKEFDDLVNIDPTKTKKYLDKLCSWFSQGTELKTLEEYIPLYDVLCNKNLLKQKDINSFKEFSQFKTIVDNNRNVTSKTEIKNKLKEDVEVIMNNDRFLIVKPLTTEASQIYGAGTRWCTAAREDDKNMFHYYHEEESVILYYILDKSKTPYDNIKGNGDKLYKVAVAVYPDGKKKEIFDAKDDKIPFTYVTDKMGLSKSIFKPISKKEIQSKRDKKLNIQLERILSNGTLNKDGRWDIKGDVFLQHQDLNEIPVKFGKVTGDFYVNNNNLTTLENGPTYVGGNYDCSYNNLKNLKYIPTELHKKVNIRHNDITTLEWFPTLIKGFLLYGGQKNKDFTDADILKVCKVTEYVLA